MQCLQWNRLKQWKFSKAVSFMLAVLFCFTSLPEFPVSGAVLNDTSGGFELEISWSDDDLQAFDGWSAEKFDKAGINREDVEREDTFVNYSEDSKECFVTMRVHYRNNTITTGYDAGKIIITVPGLKGAVRAGNSAKAAEIAADPASSPIKQYNWSYTYTEVNDTYTFTNNYPVEQNNVFDGYFELAWKLDPRETSHGYRREGATAFQAELFAKGANVQSNTLNYQQYRDKDVYCSAHLPLWRMCRAIH